MITDDIKAYYKGDLTLREIVPLCLASGMGTKHVAALLDVSVSAVYKNRNDAAGNRTRAIQAASDKRRNVYYEPKAVNHYATVDRSAWDSYDVSEPVWIEQPADPEIMASIRASQLPPPEPVPVVARTRVAAIESYLDGDRTALRVYLDSVGR